MAEIKEMYKKVVKDKFPDIHQDRHGGTGARVPQENLEHLRCG